MQTVYESNVFLYDWIVNMLGNILIWVLSLWFFFLLNLLFKNIYFKDETKKYLSLLFIQHQRISINVLFYSINLYKGL